MAHDSPTDLRVLVALRVAGVVETDDLADVAGLSDVEVMRALEARLAAGEVERVAHGATSGWRLHPSWREGGPDGTGMALVVHRLAEADLDASGQRAAVEAALDRFLPLDDELVPLARRWDWKHGGVRPNDHGDEAYDHEQVQALVDLHHEVAAACAELSSALSRYEPYGVRLHTALEHLLAGRGDWFTGEQVSSYDLVSAQLRADLLLTTGRWPHGLRPTQARTEEVAR